MQLIEVPAKTGYVWFRQGIWLFRKNPLAFLTLFFAYLLVMTLVAQIPYVGGVLPLVLSVVLIGLPESLRFMVLRGWPAERIAAVLRRIAPRESFDGARFVLPEEP